jgi:hypothetical protein
MEAAEPGAHLEAFAGWHPAVTEMIGAAPQSPRWGLFAVVRKASCPPEVSPHLTRTEMSNFARL